MRVVSQRARHVAGTAALAAACLAAAPATAQSVTLTDDSGRPLIVGGASVLGEGLATAKIAPQDIVAEFQRLCLPDPAGAAPRVGASPLALAPADAVFPAQGKQPEARVAQWRGPSATLSVSTGDEAGLKKQPIAITSRAYVTTGPYGPFKAAGAQCNLVVLLPDFAAATELSAALTVAFGAPGKLVIKKTFADGYWNAAPGTRINFTAPTTRSGPQPVHVSAQTQEKDTIR